jgi:hypothetical protein
MTDRFRWPHALLLALCAAPFVALVWALPYWPGQDAPNHLAIAQAISRYGEPGNLYEKWFTVSLGFRPYMLEYHVLIGLGRVVGLETAHRLLLTTTILITPLATLLLVRRLAPARWPNVFLTMPLVVGWSVMMGFTGFVLGVPLSILAAAIAPIGQTSIPRLVAAAALIFVAGFFHPVAAGLGLLLVGGLEIGNLRTRGAWLRLAVLALPVLAFTLLAAGEGEPGRYCDPAWLVFPYCPARNLQLNYLGPIPNAWNWLMDHATLSLDELPFRLIPSLALWGGAAVALWRTRGRDPVVRGVAIAAGAALVIFFVAPEGFGRNVAFIWLRLLLAAELTLAAIAVLPPWATPWRVGAIGLGLSVAVALPMATAGARISKRVEQIARVGQAIPPGSVVLPLDFDFRAGEPSVIQPMRHVWGWLTLDRDVITPFMFAGGVGPYGSTTGYRAINYRPEFAKRYPLKDEDMGEVWPIAGAAIIRSANLYDYVLVMRAPHVVLEQLGQHLKAVTHDGDVWLFEGGNAQ